MAQHLALVAFIATAAAAAAATAFIDPPPHRVDVAGIYGGALGRRCCDEGAFFGRKCKTSPPLIFAATDNDGDDNPSEDFDEGNDDGDLDMSELSRRISELTESESSTSDAFESGLLRRVRAVAAAEEAESAALGTGRTKLPVIAFDCLLPNQRLTGTTSDQTFGRLLRDLGLGGLFVMVSLDPRARKLRRNGVVTRIEMVDVDRPASSSWGGVGPGGEPPTAVDFMLTGRARCRIVGPMEGMVARVGRWRRGYDPDGEEAVLGWGEERFLDSLFGTTEGEEGNTSSIQNSEGNNAASMFEWSLNEIDCSVDEDSAGEEVTDDLIAKASSLVPLIEKWKCLASDPRTYDNTDVVATARIQKGQPGLRTDPTRLINNVLSDLGRMPPPTEPTALAFWGAALINPLPPLGAALEIRGKMLEATTAKERLELLEWGVSRSIANLEGTRPL